MKLRSDLHLYVIGLRRCAEVRVGKKPPVPHTTSFSKTVPVTRFLREERIDELGIRRAIPKTVQKTVEFKQTTWTGGRVIGPISSNSLAYLGISVLRDKVREVPAKLVDRLLQAMEARNVE